MLEFTWNSRDLNVWKDRKVDQALTRALTKAGSEAVRAMKAASSRSVRQRKRIKVARVNKSLPLTFPRGKSLHELVWRMDVSGAPMPVVDFPHRQGAKGVSAAISTGKRTMIRSAFVATMRSGHTGVFRRLRGARLPIKELFTSKVSDVFLDEGMIPAVFTHTKAVFGRAFQRLMPLELRKLKR